MHPNHLLVLIISYMQLPEASVSENHVNIEILGHFFDLDRWQRIQIYFRNVYNLVLDLLVCLFTK